MTSPPQEHPNGSPQEDPKSLRRWVTALLVLGIVAQTAVLFARSTDFVGIMSTPTPTPIMVGNQVSGIQARSDVDGFFRFIPISGRSFWLSIQNVFIATPSLLYGLSGWLTTTPLGSLQ